MNENGPTADSLIDTLRDRCGGFVELRRDLHRHPKLGPAERRTAGVVAQKQECSGRAVGRGVAGTGVVGQLRRGTGRGQLGLRAGMDALPMAGARKLDRIALRPRRDGFGISGSSRIHPSSVRSDGRRSASRQARPSG